MTIKPDLPAIKRDTSKPFQSARVREAAGLRTAPQQPPRLPDTILPAHRSLEVPLIDLEPDQCKYATNKAAPGEMHLFCGHPQQEGSPYCPAHHRIVYPNGATR